MITLIIDLLPQDQERFAGNWENLGNIMTLGIGIPDKVENIFGTVAIFIWNAQRFILRDFVLIANMRFTYYQAS